MVIGSYHSDRVTHQIDFERFERPIPQKSNNETFMRAEADGGIAVQDCFRMRIGELGALCKATA